jgi:hypothetical protein
MRLAYHLVSHKIKNTYDNSQYNTMLTKLTANNTFDNGQYNTMFSKVTAISCILKGEPTPKEADLLEEIKKKNRIIGAERAEKVKATAAAKNSQEEAEEYERTIEALEADLDNQDKANDDKKVTRDSMTMDLQEKLVEREREKVATSRARPEKSQGRQGRCR